MHLNVHIKTSMPSKKRLETILSPKISPTAPSSVKEPKKIQIERSLNNTACTPGTKKPIDQLGFKPNSRHNSLGTINFANMSKAREKLRNYVAGIDQYKFRLQKEREQMKSVIISKREFQSTSFEKYLEKKAKPSEKTAKEFRVQLTTKNCHLNDSSVYLELLPSPQIKISRSTSHLVRDRNLNLNSPFKLKDAEKENIYLGKEASTAKPKKPSRIESTFQSILAKVKLKSCIQNYAAKRQTEITGLQEKIKNLGTGFRHKLNQKLMFNLFSYQLKLNNKTHVIRILSIYPNFVSMKDKFHRYPIHYTASRSMGKMTKILISFNSPLDLPDQQGKRALDYAYAKGDIKIVRVD